jgi:hypothetical protein
MVVAMARRFHPRVLFEKWWRPPGPYPTFTAELDAVHSGVKGMSRYGLPVGEMLRGHRYFVDVLRGALDRDLVIVIQNNRIDGLPFARQEPSLFVIRPEELWRIPAYLALRDTAFVGGGTWHEAAEAQTSFLLGYTKKQRETWIARLREEGDWGGKTIYALLDADRRAHALSAGKRCFGPAAALVGLELFFPRGHFIVKKRAAMLVPKGLTLARACVAWKVVEPLFGPRSRIGRGFATATVTAKLAAATNAALQSNVQFLTRAGWR